jgi:phenylalanine-4-hydroxylase
MEPVVLSSSRRMEKRFSRKRMPEFIYEHTQELKDRMYVVGQDFDSIAVADHQIWRELYRRQESILKDRASEEWYAGMQKLAIGLDGIPNYDDVSDLL